ncbi:MAG TPA: hypothetical protein VE057_01285 [Archangium sp.]|nr:hypothetical protein [Archangium sp.]
MCNCTRRHFGVNAGWPSQPLSASVAGSTASPTVLAASLTAYVARAR